MIPQQTSRHPGSRLSLHVVSVPASRPLTVVTDAPTLVVPNESAIAHVREPGGEHTLDRSTFLVLPGETRMSLRPAMSVARVALLALHAPLLALVVRTYKKLGLERKKLDAWLKRAAVVPRTVWVHEIVHRYVFERHALGEHDNQAVRFLEVEIAKEVYYLFRDRDEGADRSSIQRKHSAPVERALRHIEAHLFDGDVAVARLARLAGVSESTLLRTFHRELGCAPATFARHRRLEASLDRSRCVWCCDFV
jgi:hypothetical protein